MIGDSWLYFKLFLQLKAHSIIRSLWGFLPGTPLIPDLMINVLSWHFFYCCKYSVHHHHHHLTNFFLNLFFFLLSNLISFKMVIMITISWWIVWQAHRRWVCHCFIIRLNRTTLPLGVPEVFPCIIVIGALGRCGRGALEMANKIGIPK